MFDPTSQGYDVSRFLKFCIVGGLGFVADTAILLALVKILGVQPVLAKALSFFVAVIVTYECNRRWAFGAVSKVRWLPTFLAYLGVQTTGFAVNWVVFALAQAALPRSTATLVLCAAIASLAAMMLNFLGARRLVFRSKPDKP